MDFVARLIIVLIVIGVLLLLIRLCHEGTSHL